jgi:F-type H+-transporting ATPase subunit b
MDINATLIGQFITFAIFVWFNMKFVWPPIVKAMQERKQKIADGLAAADRGRLELELAQHKAAEILRDAKIQAAEIVDDTNKRGNLIIEEAKEHARTEAERIIVLGKSEIDRELQKAKQELKDQVAILALDGAEKILGANIDKAANSEIINKLITEI